MACGVCMYAVCLLIHYKNRNTVPTPILSPSSVTCTHTLCVNKTTDCRFFSNESFIMNPITNAKNLKKISDKEIEMGISGTSASWHNMYKDSAWIFVGGLDYELTEGDIIAVFSEYGEIVNINLIRDRKNGKSKGFVFICYEDQRSTILAVDNLNTITLCGRIIRVDHVESYKVPKVTDDMDEETKRLYNEGCAPIPQMVAGATVKEEDQTSSRSEKKHKHKDKRTDDERSKRRKEKEKRSDRHEDRHRSHRRRSRSSENRKHDDRRDRRHRSRSR